ncbi:GNAT family N-acetyltransferase [Rathayibacter sp. VKM Ac-2878]|nr:GNAT family N-acetyltransferase [Rathayibacter sp. VKM Ac-2879]MBF4504515.1 GNAT family N-acetyltransferase [Rathayibacter sp. VKM Ac-2878]
MEIQDARSEPVELRSERLRLRPSRIADAAFHRRLWEERDERVPAQRRITADGHPTVAEMQMWLRGYEQTPAPGLFVVEQLATAGPVGYCGLVENSVGHPEEPELAFEFLREFRGRGFATEASRASRRSHRCWRSSGYPHRPDQPTTDSIRTCGFVRAEQELTCHLRPALSGWGVRASCWRHGATPGHPSSLHRACCRSPSQPGRRLPRDRGRCGPHGDFRDRTAERQSSPRARAASSQRRSPAEGVQATRAREEVVAVNSRILARMGR